MSRRHYTIFDRRRRSAYISQLVACLFVGTKRYTAARMKRLSQLPRDLLNTNAACCLLVVVMSVTSSLSAGELAAAVLSCPLVVLSHLLVP